MKRFLPILLLAAALVAPQVAEAKRSDFVEGNGRYTMHWNGLNRPFELYLPENLPIDAPLVIFLHGYGGKADPDRYWELNQTADENGFAVCYPQGEKAPKGKTGWNVGYPKQEGWDMDDVSYICDLAHYLQREVELSEKNTFCTGMSNGGDIIYLIAYLRPEVFAAMAPIAGLAFEWFYKKYEAKQAVPLLEVHGTKDKTSMWEGDPDNTGGWGPYISVPEAVGYWAKVAGSTHEITGEIAPRTPHNGHRIITHKYVGGKDGVEVWLYEIVGGAHKWGDVDLDTAGETWKFFSKYLK